VLTRGFRPWRCFFTISLLHSLLDNKSDALCLRCDVTFKYGHGVSIQIQRRMEVI
jgi:hypothetical protein